VNRLLLKILVTCLLSYGFYHPDDKGASVQDLLKRAAKKDKAAFATEYLHAAFSSWQDRFNLENFRIDSVFAKGEYDEMWLNLSGAAAKKDMPRLALLITRQPARKIVEARRLLLTERERLQPIEQELVEFVERFAWIYEIGVESFMQDFLFPSHLKLRYQGLSNQSEILARLRAKFKDSLPIQSLGWEGRNYLYVIRLVLDSPLQPLEISVDIQKHLNANFFEMVDKSERVQALKDSLRIWSAQTRISNASRDLIVTAQTPREAIDKILGQHFKNYDLAMLDSAAKSANIEATLPAIEGLRPASLRYRLETSRAGANKFAIWPSWLASRDGSGSSLFDELSGMTIRRYSALNLPPAFQLELAETRNTAGSLVIHSVPADSFSWRDAAALQNMLRGLARNKPAYFFLQDAAKNAGNVLVTGYTIWRDPQRLWQHIAKIHETYSSVNLKSQLRHIKIDLYPFIRLDNVRALIAPPDTSSRRREKIIIQK
jgi:hypothetical protein